MEPAAPTPAPNNKFLIMALAGFGVLLLIVMIIIVSSNSAQKKSVSENPTKEAISDTSTSNSDGTPQVTGEPTPANGWKVYQSATYTINYPPGWKAEESKATSTSSGVRITPASPQTNSTSPIFIVIAQSSSTTPSISQRQQAFAALGFKTDSLLINNVQANRLKGTIPSKVASSSAVSKVLHLTHIYFNKDSYSYLFDYSYLSKGEDATLEDIFFRMASSFRYSQLRAQ